MLGVLFPFVLVTHIALAIALFLPSVLLPFAFRARRGGGARSGAPPASERSANALVRLLLAIQARGTLVIGAGLAATGLLLVLSLGVTLLAQPWLLVALSIYALVLGLSYFVQIPRLRQLLGMRAEDDGRWATLARRQRYVSYVMAGLVGTIGFLMSTKPSLW